METKPKPKAVEIVEFKEELIPSGRKLFHCLLKDKFGNSLYRWTPPWKGDRGVERLFFKALEIEEWNDFEGVWSKELKKVSQELPSLDAMRLPIKIKLGEMTEEMLTLAGEEHSSYKVEVQILTSEEKVHKKANADGELLCIGSLKLQWNMLQKFILQHGQLKAISTGIEEAQEWFGSEWHGDWDVVGVKFHVWLESGLERQQYQVIGKDIVRLVRVFIRKRISDYKALNAGFDALETD